MNNEIFKVKKLRANKEFEVILDSKGLELFNKFNWSVRINKNVFYLYRCILFKRKPIRTIHFHREVLGISDNKVLIDHINHNGLDNRLTNLRICSHSQNTANTRKIINKSSKYKGVSWHRKNKMWTARVRKFRNLNIGSFDSEKKAAMAYDYFAIKAFGDFSHTNFNKEIYNNFNLSNLLSLKSDVTNTGYKNISFTNEKTYRVTLVYKNKPISLGTFKELNDAIKVITEFRLNELKEKINLISLDRNRKAI